MRAIQDLQFAVQPVGVAKPIMRFWTRYLDLRFIISDKLSIFIFEANFVEALLQNCKGFNPLLFYLEPD